MPTFIRRFDVEIKVAPEVVDLSWKNVGKTEDKVVHKKFFQAIANTSARTQKLNLSYNSLANLLTNSNHDFRHTLFEILKRKQISSLDLSANKLAQVPIDTLKSIFISLPNSLEQLDLSGNHLFDHSVASLVQLLSPLFGITIVFDTHAAPEKINSLQSELQILGRDVQFVSKASLLETKSVAEPEMQNSEVDTEQNRGPGFSL